MEIEPIVLLSLNIIILFYLLFKYIFQNYNLNIHLKFINHFGIKLYLIIETIYRFLTPLITFMSAKYLFFNYYWFGTSLFTLILSGFSFFILLINYFILKTPMDFPSKTDWLTDRLYRDKNLFYMSLFTEFIFLFSWTKTYNFLQFNISHKYETITTITLYILFLFRIIYFSIKTIKDKKSSRKLNV